MIKSLSCLLYTFLSWHPARINTFAELILAVIQAKTVRVKEMAMFISANGNLKAKITKLERFFRLQSIDFITIGKIVIKLLKLKQKVLIAIDRTNWQFGKANINFFVAAVIFADISLPIAYILLDKKGNSSTKERKKLIEDVMAIIPVEQIELVVADREFVGEEWLKSLQELGIAFAIRMKKCEQIKHENGGLMKLGKYFLNLQVGDIEVVSSKMYNGLEVKITCLRLENDLLIVVSNELIGKETLIAYKKRWSIERSFKALKTSGFNLEDTHMTDKDKLRKLFAILSLALTVCVIAGNIKNKVLPIKTKNHGRNLYSLFTYGFDWVKEYLYNVKHKVLLLLFRQLKYTFTTLTYYKV